MIEYPTIPYWNRGILNTPIYAFDKLDGSNVRCEWSRKRGWHKFGTKKMRIDESDQVFGQSVPTFLAKYGDPLDKFFRKAKAYRNADSMTVFVEYFGPKSFAGYHVPGDEMDVVLFDVVHPHDGFVFPKVFIHDFEQFGIPRLIYYGNLNKSFVNAVKLGEYDVKEGVICKGVRHFRGQQEVWRVKVKTRAWFDSLRQLGEDKLLEELNGDLSELELAV